MRAYGLRASEIIQSPKHNPRGAKGDGIFADHIGADGTTIWAAATSGTPAIAVHLLACMLARVWTGPEATAIWVELVAERQQKLTTAYSQANFDASQVAAAQVLLSREQLSRWDASARAWLQTADQANEHRQKQVSLIVDNLGLKVSQRPTLYEDVTHAWTSALMMMNKLVSGIPQSVTEGAVILGLSAWHIYPNMVVLYNGAKPIDQKDPFVTTGGLVTLGLQRRRGTDQAVSWSLPLANLRYYGDPVITERAISSYDNRLSIKQLLQLSLGSLLCCWGYKPDALFEVVEILVLLGKLMSKHKENLKCNWVTLLASTAGELLRCEEGPPRVEIIRLIRTGYRRYKTFLGPFPRTRLSLFDLASPGVVLGLMSQNNRILFLQDLAARHERHGEVFIIQYKHVSPKLSEGSTYSCLVVAPQRATATKAKRLREGEDDMNEPTNHPSAPIVRLLSWQNQPVKICNMSNEIIISASPVPNFDFGHQWDDPPEAFRELLESRRSSDDPEAFRDLLEGRRPSSPEQGVEASWTDSMADSNLEDSLRIGTFEDILDLGPIPQWENDSPLSPKWQLPVYLHYIYGDPGRAALYAAKLDISLNRAMEMYKIEASFSQTKEALEKYANPAAVYKHLTHVPTEHYGRFRSLQALATVSKVYEQMEDAKVDIKAACFALSECSWLPPDNLAREATAYVDIEHDILSIEQTLSCVVMFESGLYNMAPSNLSGVFGMSTGNSLYIPDLLLPDSAGKLRDRFKSLRRVTGNLGRAGIALLISPSNLRMRDLDHGSYSLINHAVFDGKMEDSFAGTTLHLSFTDWEMPVDVGQYGLRDTPVYLLEAAASVYDKGRWVGDIDILRAVASSNLLLLEGPSGHAHPHNTQDSHVLSGLISIEHWEEFSRPPRRPVS